MPQHTSRKRRVRWFVRLIYLVAYSLIGSGLYINWVTTTAGLAGLASDTDFDNLDVSEVTSPSDQLIVERLAGGRLDAIIEQRLDADTIKKFSELNELVSTVDALNPDNILDYTVQRTGQRLADILRGELEKLKESDEKYANAQFHEEDLNLILSTRIRVGRGTERASNVLRSLRRDQRLFYVFDESGHLLYLSLLADIRSEYRFIREGDAYFGNKETKATISRQQVLAGVVGSSRRSTDNPNGYPTGSSVEQTLRNMGVNQIDLRSIMTILSDQGVESVRNAQIKVIGSRQYVGDVLVGPAISNVQAVQVVVPGRAPVYAIRYRQEWANEKGFKPNAPSFSRYPFTFEPRVTSKFNPARRNPVTGRVSPHKGVDFGVALGTPIVAPADGVVTRVAYQANGAGYYIIITHNKVFQTVYMHLSRQLVTENQTVAKGQLIAYSGNTGRSTGPHLHYEIHMNGIPMDPLTVTLPSSGPRNLNTNQDFLKRSRELVKSLERQAQNGR